MSQVDFSQKQRAYREENNHNTRSIIDGKGGYVIA